MTSSSPAVGLPIAAELPWGTHLCHFYGTGDDPLDAFVPYFEAGLAANERCVWIASAPLSVDAARRSLARNVPDLDRRIAAGQLVLFEGAEWYRSVGSGSPDATIARWLELEAEATRRGFNGLRIAGSATWVGSDGWAAFSDYESKVHRTFHGRRIVALCSYPLGQCAPEQIIDVLRSHRFAVMRRSGRWEIVRSATEMLAAASPPIASAAAREIEPHRHHAARLYRSREAFTGQVAQIVATALREGEGVALLADATTLELLATGIAQAGVDAQAARARGALVELDAQPLANQILADDRQLGALFEAHVARAVRPLLERGQRVRAYGELVNLLCARGRADLALAAEERWNALLAGGEATLLCGYELETVAQNVSPEDFGRLCDQHAVVTGEGAIPEAGDRLVARLQHSLRASELETRRRRELSDHLSRLHTATFALSQALSPEDVAQVVSAELSRQLGAVATLFSTRFDAGPAVVLARSGFPAEGALEALEARVQGLTPVWLDEDTRDPALMASASVHSVACLPLVHGTRRIGAIAFGFGETQLPAMQRALLEDVAKQISLTIERARLYQLAKEAERRALQASSAKDDFLAMLGHELRNPLAPILTAIELMRLRGVDESTERERALIERQTRNMSRLVDDLLDVSRITRGKLELKKQVHELSAIVTRALETASPLLEQRRHRLTIEVAGTGLPVEGDAMRLAQVLSNLLINSANYTAPGGQITVAAAIDAGQVRVSVSDNGRGISPELLPAMFELFVQEERGVARQPGGLGLGLTIARSLVELHGGRISAASAGPGRGSTFTVWLPLADRVESRPPPPVAPERSTTSRRLLVVDDNRDAADALADVLREAGHVVEIAYDGPEALQRIAGFAPELAILDIGLPVMDGYELARQLRTLGFSALPIVALTGYGQDSDRQRAASAGFAAHLVKPVEIDDLERLVTQMCDAAESAASPGK
jgi:signal transduction histidine kinase/ActR/RegA family two-component response regulator